MPWRGKGYRTLVWQSNGPDTMGAFGGCIVSDAYLLILFLVQI